MALYKTEQHEAADQEYNNALLASNLEIIKLICLDKGINLYVQKKYKEAIDLYKTVIRIDPFYSKAFFNLAIVYDEYYEDKQPALKYYQDFVLLEKDETSARIQAENRIKALKEKLFFNK